MSSKRNDHAKIIKKDPDVRREVLNELDEATDRPEVGREEAQYRHRNRDQARGDWDRSRRGDDPPV